MLVPNKPINRLRYVAKQYLDRDGTTLLDSSNEERLHRDAKRQSWGGIATDGAKVTVDVIRIAYNMTGLDDEVYAEDLYDARRDIEDLYERSAASAREESLYVPFEQIEVYVEPQIGRDIVTELLTYADIKLPKRDEYDFVIPWAARELWRIVKAMRRAKRRARPAPELVVGDVAAPVVLDDGTGWGLLQEQLGGAVVPAEARQPIYWDYTRATRRLREQARAIGQWVKYEGLDLNRLDLAEALEGVKSFEVEAPVSPGEVVYTFDDGYTIQLLPPECVDDEGKVMQHCVGGYEDAVRSGRSMILSLRTARGTPRVTIELRPLSYSDSDDPEIQALARLPGMEKGHAHRIRKMLLAGEPIPRDRARFVQIMGKQNQPPVDKYKAYLGPYFAEMFPEHVAARLGMVREGETIDMRGAVVRDVDFASGGGGVHAGAATYMPDFDLRSGQWDGATFERCWFGLITDLSMNNTTFDSCRFSENWLRVQMHDAVIRKTPWVPDYGRLKIEDCDLHGTTFDRCNLGKSIIHDTNLNRTTFIACNLDRVELREVMLEGVRIVDLPVVDWVSRYDRELGEIVEADIPRYPRLGRVEWVDFRPIDPDVTAKLLGGRGTRMVPLGLTEEQVKALGWLYVGDVPGAPKYAYHISPEVSMGELGTLLELGLITEDDFPIIHKWARERLRETARHIADVPSESERWS